MEIDIIKENIIRFKRLNAINVSGYKILAKEYIDKDKFTEYVLDIIDNPAIPTPIKHTIQYPYKRDLTYELPNDIYYDSKHQVIVYINDVPISNMNYTYNPKLKLLTILLKEPQIKDSDKIKVEYYIDEIEYIHRTTNKTEYKIIPIINYEHNIGTHTVLK